MLGAAVGMLGRWFVGVADLPVGGDFKRRRQHSATTAHRALPVCEWPALGMLWGSVQKVWQGCAEGLCGLRFCRFMEISTGGGSTRQPQRTGPCQYVSGQHWSYHGALQGQMQPLQSAALMVGPTLGAAAGLSRRWFVGIAKVVPVEGDFQRSRQHSATTAHRALPVCEWPALHMPQSTARSGAVSAVRSSCGWACTEAAAGLGGWFAGVVVFPGFGDF